MVAARQHHVVPYLAANLDRLDIPGQARSELEAAAGRQHAGAAVLAADLSVALEALRDAGVRALAFKGVALAAQAYGDFAMRGAGDLDLLVAPEDLARAHEALAAAGWRPAPGYPTARAVVGLAPLRANRQRADAQSAPAATSTSTGTLCRPAGTFPDFDTLWERREVVSVDGHPMPTLSRYDALAHSAGHAAKDRWRWMRSLLDVHVLASPTTTRGSSPTGRCGATSCSPSVWLLASSAPTAAARWSSTRGARRSTTGARSGASRPGQTAPASPAVRRSRARASCAVCAGIRLDTRLARERQRDC